MEEIKDVEPPIDPPSNYLFAIVLVLLFITGILLSYIIRKLRKPKPVVILPPWQIAQKQLEELRKENLPGGGKIKEFYTRLSAIIRHYLEDQLNIRAPEMTTEEFLIFLKQSMALSEEQKNALKNFLDCCDMVKFAKYSSNIEETEQSLNLAQRLIEETKPKVQPPLPETSP